MSNNELDVELDNEGVIEFDNEPLQKASQPCSHPYSINYVKKSQHPLLCAIVCPYIYC